MTFQVLKEAISQFDNLSIQFHKYLRSGASYPAKQRKTQCTKFPHAFYIIENEKRNFEYTIHTPFSKLEALIYIFILLTAFFKNILLTSDWLFRIPPFYE